jgi:hypothetical protein
MVSNISMKYSEKFQFHFLPTSFLPRLEIYIMNAV